MVDHSEPEINKGRVSHFGINKRIMTVRTQGERQAIGNSFDQ
jgi:hypothetical protein